MKTAAILKQEIKDILDQIKAEQKSVDFKQAAKRIVKLRSTIPTLKMFLTYMETEPKEAFIYKEVERITNRIGLFQADYKQLDAEKFTRGQVTAHRKKFEKEMGIPKLREQLKALNYILK